MKLSYEDKLKIIRLKEQYRIIQYGYPLNVGNHLWLSSKTNEVVACQKRALKYVDEYKKLAASATKSSGMLDDVVHVDNKAKEKIEKTIRYLEYKANK